jgi:hypothetical protein
MPVSVPFVFLSPSADCSPQRQSRSRSSAPRSPPPQARGAHTAAVPSGYSPARAPAPPAGVAQAQPKQPGMLAQMAATAGSVAVGSTIGHGLSSMLFGGRSDSVAPEAQQPPVQQQQSPYGASCDFQVKGDLLSSCEVVECLTGLAEFTKCLESADVNSCSWYLEQLKAVRSRHLSATLTFSSIIAFSVRPLRVHTKRS